MSKSVPNTYIFINKILKIAEVSHTADVSNTRNYTVWW